MRRDPQFQVLHRRTATAFWPLGMKLLASVPDMMLFFYRAGGHMVLAALLGNPPWPIPIIRTRRCRTPICRQFGVSRAPMSASSSSPPRMPGWSS